MQVITKLTYLNLSHHQSLVRWPEVIMNSCYAEYVYRFTFFLDLLVQEFYTLLFLCVCVCVYSNFCLGNNCRFQRPPGAIPSSMLGLEALTGSLDDFGFEDYLNGNEILTDLSSNF